MRCRLGLPIIALGILHSPDGQAQVMLDFVADALREPVASIDWRRKDLRDHWIEIDDGAALQVRVALDRSFWDSIAENLLPGNWVPVDRVEIVRDGVPQQSIDLKCVPFLTPAGETFVDRGTYAFSPEAFTEGETVQFAIWRSGSRTLL